MPSVFVITTPATSRDSDSYDDLDGIISNSAFVSKAGALKSLRKLVEDDVEDLEPHDEIGNLRKDEILALNDEELEVFAAEAFDEPYGITELELEG